MGYASRVYAIADNLPGIVDGTCVFQRPAGAWIDDPVQVDHRPIAVKESTAVAAKAYGVIPEWHCRVPLSNVRAAVVVSCVDGAGRWREHGGGPDRERGRAGRFVVSCRRQSEELVLWREASLIYLATTVLRALLRSFSPRTIKEGLLCSHLTKQYAVSPKAFGWCWSRSYKGRGCRLQKCSVRPRCGRRSRPKASAGSSLRAPYSPRR